MGKKGLKAPKGTPNLFKFFVRPNPGVSPAPNSSRPPHKRQRTDGVVQDSPGGADSAAQLPASPAELQRPAGTLPPLRPIARATVPEQRDAQRQERFQAKLGEGRLNGRGAEGGGDDALRPGLSPPPGAKLTPLEAQVRRMFLAPQLMGLTPLNRCRRPKRLRRNMSAPQPHL